MDADAISIFEDNKKIFLILLKKKILILTPHTGEFKKIFNYSKKLKN